MAQRRLEHGMAYAQAVNSARIRAATALPALIGARTLALMQEAGAQALHRPVKVPRRQVRGVLVRLALTLASRGPLASEFARLQQGRTNGRWDNPPHDA
jgi:farnesyl-diphosphate farnesyltransferase